MNPMVPTLQHQKRPSPPLRLNQVPPPNLLLNPLPRQLSHLPGLLPNLRPSLHPRLPNPHLVLLPRSRYHERVRRNQHRRLMGNPRHRVVPMSRKLLQRSQKKRPLLKRSECCTEAVHFPSCFTQSPSS